VGLDSEATASSTSRGATDCCPSCSAVHSAGRTAHGAACAVAIVRVLGQTLPLDRRAGRGALDRSPEQHPGALSLRGATVVV